MPRHFRRIKIDCYHPLPFDTRNVLQVRRPGCDLSQPTTHVTSIAEQPVDRGRFARAQASRSIRSHTSLTNTLTTLATRWSAVSIESLHQELRVTARSEVSIIQRGHLRQVDGSRLGACGGIDSANEGLQLDRSTRIHKRIRTGWFTVPNSPTMPRNRSHRVAQCYKLLLI